MELVKLKALLGIEDDSKDVILEFVIADVEEIIKNYCHVEEMPEGLVNTGYRMAMDLYRNENIGSETAAVGAVSSISEGDTSTYCWKDVEVSPSEMERFLPFLREIPLHLSSSM